MLRRVNWGGSLFFSDCLLGALLILVLASFLFRLALSGFLAGLSGYHYCLGNGPDIISGMEYLSARRYSSSIIAGGSRDRD